MKLSVLQYNMFCRPSYLFKDSQIIRAEWFCNTIFSKYHNEFKDVDIIVFCELFDNDARQTIQSALSKYGFRYRTAVIGNTRIVKRCCLALCNRTPRFLVENGGLIIFSRHPIVGFDTNIYANNEIIGTDSLSAKGVMYAQILKNQKKIHLFATHMQAWNDKKDKIMRFKEAEKIKEFIISKVIPEKEPVLICGDFNIDLHDHKDEAKRIINIMDGVCPIIIGPEQYTSNPDTNTLVGEMDRKNHINTNG